MAVGAALAERVRELQDVQIECTTVRVRDGVGRSNRGKEQLQEWLEDRHTVLVDIPVDKDDRHLDRADSSSRGPGGSAAQMWHRPH